MSTWHGVKTWSPGDILTAIEMNQFVRDNTEFLFDSMGTEEFATVAVELSAAASMTFQSIPQTHHHIIMFGQARTDEGEFTFSTLRLTFGDTSNTLITDQYRTLQAAMDGTGAIPAITETVEGGLIANINGATLRGGFCILIPNYSHAFTHKGAVSFWGDNHGTAGASMRAGVNHITRMNMNAALGRVRLHSPGTPNIGVGSNVTMLLAGRR